MNALWTTCLVVALGAQPVETSSTPTTRLYVRTIPPGARVVLDGKDLGTTDGLFLVPPGTGKLSIMLDGRQPEIRQVEISEGRITRIEVALKKGEQPQAGPAASAAGIAGIVPGLGGVGMVDGGGGPVAGDTTIELPPGLPGLPDRPVAPAEPPGEIEKALESKTKLDFHETPLEQVAAFLSETCKINVSLDKKTLEEWKGLGADTPVTFKVSGIPVRSALTTLLRDLDLVWTVHDRTLEITSREALEGLLSPRVYAVSDVTSNSAGLKDLIMAVLEPESWDEFGGPGSIVADRAQGKELLVVSQTEPVHRQVAAFLADLRTVARQPADKLPVAVSHEGWWRQTPESDAVRKALEQKLTCEFKEAPLADVLQFLHDNTQVPVILDRRSADQAGVTPDTPLTAVHKDVALQDVLSMALKDVGLTYTVTDDVLLVTTPEFESNHITWAIYPVGDLVTAGRSVDELVSMITTTVAPQSWEEVGGTGVVRGLRGITQALVVSQSCHVHRQITALLTQLRRP